ncbi:MAG: GGDEF domain-containing protein [Candidatus Limnocylindrales bacterium]
MREQAERDPLTGLANRRAWDAAIDAARGRTTLRETSVALVFDLDGLKAINDRHGHAAGDVHLRAFGDALQAAARASDVVARLGGDEFGVLLLGGTAAAGQAFLERLRSGIERGKPTVGFSVGRSLAVDGDDLDRAVGRADRALRAEKASRPQDLFGRVRKA